VTLPSTLEQIEKIVREMLALDGVDLTAETQPGDVPGWDSLANINIVFAVEEAFGIEFSDEQLRSFATIGDFARGVDEAVAQSEASA